MKDTNNYISMKTQLVTVTLIVVLIRPDLFICPKSIQVKIARLDTGNLLKKNEFIILN